MEPSAIDTAKIAPGEQYQWYVEELERIFGIRSHPVGTSAGPYSARIDILTAPPLTYMEFEAQNNGGIRLAQQIRKVEWGHYCIYREMGEGILFELAGREIVTSRGDIVVYDGDAPMLSRAKVSFHHGIWMVPRGTLDPHLPILPRPLVVHIPASLGITGLAVAYIEALAAPLGTLSDIEAALVADNLCRLIAMACGAASRPHGNAIELARVEQAKQYVERHLSSPRLDPQLVAAALRISVRQLHALFAPTGESFGQYVRRRRLEECRATLESPLAAGRQITDIAFGWGFASLPTFYRAFQAEFGMAPGDVRPRL